MNLYEIKNEILKCIRIDENTVVDSETGEIFDSEYLDDLEMTLEEKRENIAKWIKNLDADIVALKNQKAYFTKRIESATKKREWLAEYLATDLNGNKWESDDKAVKITWRKSKVVSVPDESLVAKKWFKKHVEYKLDKTAIKEAINSGHTVRGASIIERDNMQVK